MHDSAVPYEIWTEIFQHLPRYTLLQVHLSQKRFRAISLPILFREFHLARINDHRANIALSVGANGAHDAAYAFRRLQFWTSPEIAPFVHLCRVSAGVPGLPQHLHIHKRWPVLDEFFDSFHHFTNLRRLSIVEADYNPTFLRTLRLLPNLIHLELMFSRLGKPAIDSDLETLPLLEIPEFTFFGRGSLQHWFPFLRRTKLRHFSTSCDEWLLAQLLSGDPFPCVTRLEIQMDKASTLFTNLRVLAKFPATEILTIRYRGKGKGFEGSGRDRTPLFGVLPLLKQYQGPDDLLDVLLPIPSLQRLILPATEKPNDQLARLRAVNVPNHITSLDMKFFDFHHENLRDLCVFFPHLTDLRIKVVVPHWTEDDYEEYYFGEEASWEVYGFFEDSLRICPSHRASRNSQFTGNMKTKKLIWSLGRRKYPSSKMLS
ncbi:hypothetical protein B0H12DRAFT_1244233 [Mycena haematopus]|nr:hypothetical protein B0H12DRAFT_1244233 [Mycena haematopus]